MKVKNAFCNAIFWLVIILALCELINTNSYITNISHAAILPLFLMSVLDTIYKFNEKACQFLLERRYEHKVELKEAEVVCNYMKGFTVEDAMQKKREWNDKLEKKAVDICFIDCCEQQIRKWFRWYIPIYTIILVYLFLSLVLAQSSSWIAITNFLNNDSITLWTFSLVLFDIVFTEGVAKIIIKFSEKSINKKNGTNFTIGI